VEGRLNDRLDKSLVDPDDEEDIRNRHDRRDDGCDAEVPSQFFGSIDTETWHE
jgi:hypothetical protein